MMSYQQLANSAYQILDSQLSARINPDVVRYVEQITQAQDEVWNTTFSLKPD
jgi:hypothetical protein